MKGMPGTVILHPSLSAQYRPTLTAKVRVRSPPHRGTLTLARKQGGTAGWNANRMSRLGVDEAECGTTRPAKWHWRGQ